MATTRHSMPGRSATGSAQELRVIDLMSIEPVTVAARAPVNEAGRLMDRQQIGGLPVVDGASRLVGVISQTDLLRAHADPMISVRWTGLRVEDLMSSPALTIEADAAVTKAASLMERFQVHRLVVVDRGGRPTGVLSTLDLVRALIETRR
jgi:CBS domain-containing protein